MAIHTMPADDDGGTSNKCGPADVDYPTYVEDLHRPGTSQIIDAIERDTGWRPDRTTIYKALKRHEEQGEVASYKPGNYIEWMTPEEFEREVPDQRFLHALDDHGNMATTTEVADSVGCDLQSALRRLQRLEDDGDVTSRDIGDETLWTKA